METIFKRHSVRKYSESLVEPEKIELLLKAGLSAPSACNQQPWEFYVVRDKNKLTELSKCSPFSRCVRYAPLAIVPCYRTINLRADDFVLQDMSACTENILIAAASLNLGAVWLGIAPVNNRMYNVKNALNIPDGFAAFSIIAIGYPLEEENFYRNISLSECVHYV